MNQTNLTDFEDLPPEPASLDPLHPGWASLRVAAKITGYKPAYLRKMCSEGTVICTKEPAAGNDRMAIWFVYLPSAMERRKTSGKSPHNLKND